MAGQVIEENNRAVQVLVFLIVLISLPFVLPIMLLVRIYRLILKEIILRQEGDKVMQMSADDSIWLQDNPQNRAIINSVMEFRGKLDLEKYRKAVMERLVMDKAFAKISKYPTRILHRYVWLNEPNFDINEHVFEWKDPAPTNKADLERLISQLVSAPMPVNRAAWQFIMLRPAESDPNHELLHYGVYRAHHSLGDGISMVRLLMEKLVDEPPKHKGPVRFGSKNRMQKILQTIFEGPSLLLSKFIQPSDDNVIHGQPLSGTKLVSWSGPIDLELVKKIKNASNTTVNDVLMSCMASTLAKYLKKHGDGTTKDLLSYIPVDIRSPSKEVTLDNKIGLVFLKLPMDGTDEIERLKITKKRMDAIKSSPEPVVNSLAIQYAMNRLPNWLTEAFFNWAASKSSLIISNVPGPQEKLSVAGFPLEDLIFWPPQKTNVGIGASIFSYCGNVRLGLYVDKNITTNPSVMIQGFVDSINELAGLMKIV